MNISCSMIFPWIRNLNCMNFDGNIRGKVKKSLRLRIPNRNVKKNGNFLHRSYFYTYHQKIYKQESYINTKRNPERGNHGVEF